MDHQKGDHFHLIQPELFHLALGCLNRYDQVAEQMGMKSRELAFPHWKGKDVGRPVQTEISLVQGLDLNIVDQ
jgi:hypothetical protein